MDKLIYTAMTGAKYAMSRQDTHAQNLANATTTGYRAETAAYRAVPLEGSPTRVFVLDASTGADLHLLVDLLITEVVDQAQLLRGGVVLLAGPAQWHHPHPHLAPARRTAASL